MAASDFVASAAALRPDSSASFDSGLGSISSSISPTFTLAPVDAVTERTTHSYVATTVWSPEGAVLPPEPTTNNDGHDEERNENFFHGRNFFWKSVGGAREQRAAGGEFERD